MRCSPKPGAISQLQPLGCAVVVDRGPIRANTSRFFHRAPKTAHNESNNFSVSSFISLILKSQQSGTFLATCISYPAIRSIGDVQFYRRNRALSVAVVLCFISLTVGCGWQPDFAASQSALQNRTLPFHSNTSPRSLSNRVGAASGTPILVHLQAPLSSSLCRAGDPFKAILDEAVVLGGQTVAGKGSLVTGRILEAKPSEPSREAGYLRLTLTGISLDGKSWPLQTSNVFIKGATYVREAPAPPVHLAGASTPLMDSAAPRHVRIEVREDAGVPADRLLTFHLTQPVAVENSGQ